MELFNVANNRPRGVHSRRRVGQNSMNDMFWPSMGWRALARYLLLKLRRSASDPHRVALGMAIGMWANFLPLPGIGAGLSVVFAWLLRANVMAAFIAQIPGNVWTMPFIWWISYKVGLIVFPLSEYGIGFKELMANISISYVFENWRILARSVMLPLVTGGQMIGVTLAIITYWLTNWEVRHFWAQRKAKSEERRLKRMKR